MLLKTSMLALALSLSVASITNVAQAATPQQEKFGNCAKEAKSKGLKGADYKSFMSTCAKGNSATTESAASPATKMTQQEKMKACNADAKNKGLKGKDYTNFRNTCLKGSATLSAPAQ